MTRIKEAVDQVKIELSRDGGNSFETITASTPNDGSECWAVTGPITDQAILRVSDVNNPSINGTSDYPFSIIAGGGTNPTVSTGNSLCGSLSSGSRQSVIKGNSFFTNSYSLNGTSGQQIAILMEFTDFDTYLYLRDQSNSIIAQDDNGGGGTNSRIPSGSGFFTIPSNGTYTIEATSALPNATGNYTLTLTEPCTYSLSSTNQTFPFTGDGKTDFAFWQPSTGFWYIPSRTLRPLFGSNESQKRNCLQVQTKLISRGNTNSTAIY